MYFDAVYMINLDRREDRRVSMESMLANRFSLVARRVSAIDGRQRITWDVAKMGPITQYWNKGAMGCALSHREAILDAMRQGYERVLILEDDVDISEEFFPTLEKAWTALPADWHLLYLSANIPEPVSERLNDSLYRIRKGLGTYAILWHRRAFEQCLGFLSGPYAPWDTFLSYYQLFFPCYIMNPGMAIPTAGMSDIIGIDVDYTQQINYKDPLNPRGRVPAKSGFFLDIGVGDQQLVGSALSGIRVDKDIEITESLLTSAGLPKRIDYLSCVAERLKCLDFTQYTFGTIRIKGCVTPDIVQFLQSHKYIATNTNEYIYADEVSLA